MRTPVQSRSASSADRMVDATLTLLDEGGTPAVTVAAVARAAGSSNGSLYHRFGDRHGLLRAAQERALAAIQSETAEAFDRADTEPDDDLAVRLLAHAAVDIFTRHRGAMRAFLVSPESPEIEQRSREATHALSVLVTGWLGSRLGADPARAQAAWRMLHALGATRALLDDEHVSPTRLDVDVLADALGRAVLAVVAPERLSAAAG